jgi:hypothetical protein
MKNTTPIRKHIHVSLIIVACIVFAGKLAAQNAPARDLNFAVSADILYFFTDGYPSKVLIKAYRFDEQGLIKGAWRLGINARYITQKIEVQTADEPFFVSDRDRTNSLDLYIGYEWQKQTRLLNYYFGFDIVTDITIHKERIDIQDDFPYEDKYYTASFIPFLGFEYYLSNRLSTSIEIGIKAKYHFNEYQGSGNIQENRVRQQYFTTKFQTPYTMSINYYF